MAEEIQEKTICEWTVDSENVSEDSTELQRHYLISDEEYYGHGEDSAQIQAKSRLLYESELPLFNQEIIKDLHNQIQNLTVGDQDLRVKGLDGVLVAFKNHTGEVFDSEFADLEYLLDGPVVHLVPIETMMASRYSTPQFARCNVQVCYLGKVRNKISKEFTTTPLQPYKDVQTYFERMRKIWNASESCANLKSILASTPIQCKKVVAFALGQFSNKPRYPSHEGRVFQHALLLTVCKMLIAMDQNQDEVACYAQDPAYTDIDKALLNENGIKVLDHPEGFLQVDDSSAVISCWPNAPVKQVVSDVARPALLIWKKVKTSYEAKRGTDPDSPRLVNMIRDHYVSMDFPGDMDSFRDLAIYIRRSSSL